MATIMNGTEFSKTMKEECRLAIDQYKQKGYRNPNLSVIVIGAHPASLIYVNSKQKTAQTLGIRCDVFHLEETVSQEEVIALVRSLNANHEVDGIFVQMPMPKHINSKLVVEHINPQKDVDGLHPLNLGKLMSNQAGMVPCTPRGILALILSTKVTLVGKRAVVLGRSILVGKPVAELLDQENMTVTVCHSKTQHIEEECSRADVLVVAIGKPQLVKKHWVKKGAIVIDVGINRLENGTIVGDVDFADVFDQAGFLSPVPKGVGPMTIAMLMQNTLDAYQRHMEG